MHPLFKTPISELFPVLKICLKQVGEDGRTIHTEEEQNLSSEGLELSDTSSQANNIDQMLVVHERGLGSEAIEEEKKQPMSVGSEAEKKQPIRAGSLEESPKQQ